MRVRDARPGEAAGLTELVLRSKAHWGYDAAFMARAAAELTVTEGALAGGDVFVAADEDGALLGMASIDAAADPPRLDMLFVDPAAMGRGAGSALLAEAVRRAAARGLDALVIESDPNAVPFYTARGAVPAGSSRSPSTGRELPLLRLPVP